MTLSNLTDRELQILLLVYPSRSQIAHLYSTRSAICDRGHYSFRIYQQGDRSRNLYQRENCRVPSGQYLQKVRLADEADGWNMGFGTGPGSGVC